LSAGFLFRRGQGVQLGQSAKWLDKVEIFEQKTRPSNIPAFGGPAALRELLPITLLQARNINPKILPGADQGLDQLLKWGNCRLYALCLLGDVRRNRHQKILSRERPAETFDARGLQPALAEKDAVIATPPHAWMLMPRVPVGPPVLLDVSRHTGDTGLERMICAKPAGEQSHSKLEMRDIPSDHVLHGGLLGTLGHEVPVESQKSPLARERVRIAQEPFGTRDKVSKVTRQIVLRAATTVTKEQRGRSTSVLCPPKTMDAADKTE